MLFGYSIFEKLLRVLIRKGKVAYIYNLIYLNLIYLKNSFKFFILKKMYFKNLFFLNVGGFFFFSKIFSFRILNPFFFFYIISNSIKPGSLLLNRLVKRKFIKIPFYFNTKIRSFLKGASWIASIIKKYSFIIKRDFLNELFFLYFRKSKVFILKSKLYVELMKSRENLKFFRFNLDTI